MKSNAGDLFGVALIIIRMAWVHRAQAIVQQHLLDLDHRDPGGGTRNLMARVSEGEAGAAGARRHYGGAA